MKREDLYRRAARHMKKDYDEDGHVEVDAWSGSKEEADELSASVTKRKRDMRQFERKTREGFRLIA